MPDRVHATRSDGKARTDCADRRLPTVVLPACKSRGFGMLNPVGQRREPFQSNGSTPHVSPAMAVSAIPVQLPRPARRCWSQCRARSYIRGLINTQTLARAPVLQRYPSPHRQILTHTISQVSTTLRAPLYHGRRTQLGPPSAAGANRWS